MKDLGRLWVCVCGIGRWQDEGDICVRVFPLLFSVTCKELRGSKGGRELGAANTKSILTYVRQAGFSFLYARFPKRTRPHFKSFVAAESRLSSTP